MVAVDRAARELGSKKAACEALGVPRATYYRSQRQSPPARRRSRPPRALDDAERARVLDTLNDERFVDQPPAQVHATLLDEGTYLCSARTMYRILEANEQVHERRNQLRHPKHAKPRARRDGSESGLVVGHHQAPGPGEVVVLLPLRHP